MFLIVVLFACTYQARCASDDISCSNGNVPAFNANDPIQQTVCVPWNDSKIIGYKLGICPVSFQLGGSCDDFDGSCDVQFRNPFILFNRHNNRVNQDTKMELLSGKRIYGGDNRNEYRFVNTDRDCMFLGNYSVPKTNCECFVLTYQLDQKTAQEDKELQMVKAGNFELFDSAVYDVDDTSPDDLIKDADVISLPKGSRYELRKIVNKPCVDGCRRIHLYKIEDFFPQKDVAPACLNLAFIVACLAQFRN